MRTPGLMGLLSSLTGGGAYGRSANRQSCHSKGQSCNLHLSIPSLALMGPGFQACLEMLVVRENYRESEVVRYC